MHLLYVAEAHQGGIAEYSRHQIKAIAYRGITVKVLCRPEFFPPSDSPNTEIIPELASAPSTQSSKVIRMLSYISDCRAIAKTVEETARKDTQAVLLDSFREYFSPFWTQPFRQVLGRIGKVGVIAHDPIRTFRVGPLWWHRFSVQNAYRMVSHTFIHGPPEPDFMGLRPPLPQVVTLPHGPFSFPSSNQNSNALRSKYRLGKDERVLLSFGQIRDGKNLDGVIRAMRQLPEDISLLVAGKVMSSSQRPVSYYQDLAKALGVERRCRWDTRYIEREEVSSLFQLADLVLLLYGPEFHSASGILNLAVQFKVPVLASSGISPLKQQVSDYQLGIWIRPGDQAAMVEAIHQILEKPSISPPQWNKFLRDHSWDQNAQIIINALQLGSGSSSSE
jgi:glycosyltransferase involved in cell wall biosynthesis